MNTSKARTRTWSRVDSSSYSDVAGDGPKRKKQKLHPDLQSVIVTIDLPPEIVLQIFELLPRNDLLSASLVCALWQQVSKDERIRWHTLFEIDLKADCAARCIASYEKLEPLRIQYTASIAPFIESPQKMTQIMNSENKKAIVFPEVLKGAYYGGTMSLVCLISDSQDPSSIIATRATNYWLPDLSEDCFGYFVKLSNDYKSPGVLKIEMNPKRIEKLLRHGKKLDAKLADVLVLQLLDSVRNQIVGNLFDSQMTYEPAILPALSEQPEELIGVKLHNYQLKALNWMLSTEKSEKAIAVSPLLQVTNTNLHLEIQQKTYQFVLPDQVKDYDIAVKPKGGVLADEMGLGKTVTMIGLMLTNPMKDPPVNKPYFTTKATLVFCPNHLVQQWKKEIETHCTKKLKIVVLTTINQVKKFSYQDVMDADVVIASYNLLQNKNYLAFPDNAKDSVIEKPRKDTYRRLGIYSDPSISDLTAFKRVARVDKVLQELKDKDPKTIKGVILDHFHWHRVIMDEGHELINDMSIGRFSIIRLQKTYAWYMSGTPFPTIETIHNARKLVGFDGYPIAPKVYTAGENDYWGFEEFYIHDHQYDWYKNKPEIVYQFENALSKSFVSNLIWRNTKASIVNEYKMTDVTEKYKILTLTPIEQAIYEDLAAFPPRFNSNDEYDKEISSKGSKLPPQYVLCQRLRDEWGNNLTEIRQHFIEKKEDDISKQERLLQSLVGERNRIRKVTDLDSRKIVDTFAAKKSEKLGKITKCQEIKKMLEDAQPVKLSNKDCLEGYIERHGTKLGNLVDLLKKIFVQNPSTGVIVFSRFSPYLRKIAQVLAEYNIPSSFVEGNVFSKTNAMTKFKTSANVKVILMNLEKSASGANLIEASHVILMEPLEGDQEYIKATERQTIGRAQRQGQTEPVTVTRFLVKDTIEHTSYLQHYGTNTPNNSNTTINQSPGKGTLVRSGSFSVNITKGQNNDEDCSAKSDSLSSVESMEVTDESSAMN